MKTLNLLRQLIVIGAFSLFCGLVWAEDSGQIININQSFKIAFTDLGSRVLKPNDIVKVFISPDEFLYMKVLECSPILSKLGPVQEEDFKTILQDLPRISVGNPVVKITASSQEETAPAVNLESKIMLEPPPKRDTQNQKLERELMEARTEIKNLKETNAALEAKINDLVLKVQTQEVEAAVSPVPKPNKIDDESLIKIKAQLEKIQRIINQP